MSCVNDLVSKCLGRNNITITYNITVKQAATMKSRSLTHPSRVLLLQRGYVPDLNLKSQKYFASHNRKLTTIINLKSQLVGW